MLCYINIYKLSFIIYKMNVFKKNELKLLWPFYAHSLIFSLMKVIMPFYVLYFLDIGLNFWQIALIWSIRSIIWLIFEMPTWIIADLYGRKKSVILWYILTAWSLFLIPFFDNYIYIIIIFAVNAIFETLFSGADTAWVVDMLHEKKEKLVDVYFSKKRVFRNIWLIFSPIIAWLIVSQFGMKPLWTVFAGWILLSTVFLFFGKESKNKTIENIDEEENCFSRKFYNHTKNAFWYIRKHKILVLLFLWIFVFYLIDELAGLARTPYLEQSGIKLENIWYLFSIIWVVGVFLPLLINILSKKRNKVQIMTYTAITYGLLLLSLWFINITLFLIVVFVIWNLIEDILLPLEESLTNEYIKWQNRATILSIKSMVESAAWIIWWPIVWVLLWIISLKTWLIISWGLFFVLAAVYLYVGRKEKNIFKKNM